VDISALILRKSLKATYPNVTRVDTMYTGLRPYFSAKGMKKTHPTANPAQLAAKTLFNSVYEIPVSSETISAHSMHVQEDIKKGRGRRKKLPRSSTYRDHTTGPISRIAKIIRA